MEWGFFTLLAIAGAALYAPSFDRGWTSEDFLILRLFHEALTEGRFLSVAWENAGGPWLDISLVAFYRPLASLLLQVEHWAFGTGSGYYWAAHLALHLANSALFYRLLRGLSLDSDPLVTVDHRWTLKLATAIFALYPLHPNAVVFVASFATLWGVAFMLWALCLFFERRQWAALGAATAALGCYEQAAVLPACLLVMDWLFPRDGRRLKPRRHLPFWIVTAAYLLTRKALLGQSIGGYDGFRDRLGDPAALMESNFRNLGRLLWPDFNALWGPSITAVLVLVFLGLAALQRLRRGSDCPAPWRLALLGGLWIVGSQAPFSFVGVVPGNARYWYFAALGLAMLWLSLAEILWRRSALRWAGLGILPVIVAAYGVALWQVNGLYGRAGAETESLRRQLVDLHQRSSAEEPFFVAGAPAFAKYQGVNGAQVFHWGLADALMPPFTHPAIDVYPVPPSGPRGLDPLLRAFPRSVVLYRDGALRWIERPVDLPHSPVDAPELPRLGSPPVDAVAYRLTLISRGHYWRGPFRPMPSPENPSVDLPESWVLSMRELYGAAPIYWWLEYEPESGDRARSQLGTLP